MIGAGPWRRPAAVTALALALWQPSCATLPRTETARPGSPTIGYRALFRGLAESPDGRDRFKVAVAIRPPDRLRMEFFGPVGGPRFVFAAAAARLVALDLAGRAYEEAGATAAAVERLLGLPVTPAGAIAILIGLSPGALRDPEGGAIILVVDYGDDVPRTGDDYPRQIRIDLPGRRTRVTLEAIEGPMNGDLPDALFTLEIPEGFSAGAPAAARPLQPGRPAGPG